MPRTATKTKPGPRARHMNGVNRIEQAERIQEIIRAIKPEERTTKLVDAKLRDKGINVTKMTVSTHIKKVRAAENGTPGLNGDNVLDRISAVSRALEACGGTDGLNETLKLVKKIGKVLK